jgi:hypothetical protein
MIIDRQSRVDDVDLLQDFRANPDSAERSAPRLDAIKSEQGLSAEIGSHIGRCPICGR